MSPSYPYNLRANAASSVEAPALLLGQFPSSLPYAWHPPMPEGSLSVRLTCLSAWKVCCSGAQWVPSSGEGTNKGKCQETCSGKGNELGFQFLFCKIDPFGFS